MASCRFLPLGLVLIAAAATVTLEASLPLPASLRIAVETAPPGALVQMKLFVTEPKPISTGDAFLSFRELASIDGISLASLDRDAAAVALVAGTTVALSFVSPTSSLVTDSDYPIFTVTGRVPDHAPLGTEFPFRLSADAFHLFDPFGNAYPIDVKSGSLVVGPHIAISNVVPGAEEVPAGGVVSLYGTSFHPETRVRFDEVALADVRYIDSTRIDVVLAQPARMQGMEIKAENPDGSRVEYFSYERTRAMTPSAHPVLRHAVPLFTSHQVQQAIVQFPPDSDRLAKGIALENVGRNQANVILDMSPVNGIGGGVAGGASAVVVIPAKQRLVRDVSELFGFPCDTACAVTVRSTDPLGVIGVVVEQAGTLRPVLPQVKQ